MIDFHNVLAKTDLNLATTLLCDTAHRQFGYAPQRKLLLKCPPGTGS